MAPIISIIIVLGIWFIIKDYKENVIGSIVVIFYTFIPNVFYYNFFIFMCVNIEDKFYFIYDPSIECWKTDQNHSYMAYFICTPAIIVYSIYLFDKIVIIIPIFLLRYMVKEKHRLKAIMNRKMIGFLINGYRNDKFYWEFVIFARKILLNIISIYLENSSASAKSLVIMILFIGFLILQMNLKPYESSNLNRLEEYSVAISGLSLYLTVYIVAINNDTTSKFFLIIVTSDETRPFVINILGILIIIFNVFYIISWLIISWSYLYIYVAELIPEKLINLLRNKLGCCWKNENSYFVKQKLKILREIVLVENNSSKK